MNHLKVGLRGACSVKGGTYHLKVAALMPEVLQVRVTVEPVIAWMSISSVIIPGTELDY